MTLGLLTIVYVAVGMVLAFVRTRRGASVVDAGLVVLAWPLYTPAESKPPTVDEPSRMADAVREALAGVREAASGSAFASLLGSAAERRLLDEIDRAAARMRAIDAEIAEARTRTGSASTATTAALRIDADGHLRALQTADRAAMTELAELLVALRTRIVLARHAGSSAEGPSALVAELWARIDGLGEAVALTDPAPSSSVRAPPDTAA